MFEVLDLVEVRAPVHVAVDHSPAAPQCDGVAQALAPPCKIPHPPVVPAVHVAGRAADVPFGAHAGITGVVEDLLTQQHRGGELFRGDGGYRGMRQVDRTGVEQGAELVDTHAAVHEVLHEQAPRRRVHAQSLWGEAALQLGYRRPETGRLPHLEIVQDHDLVDALQADEAVIAKRGEYRGGRGIAVIQVDAHRTPHVLGKDGELIAHGVVGIEILLGVVEQASIGVVLLGYQQRPAIRRERNAGQVVQHAPPVRRGIPLSAWISVLLVDAKAPVQGEGGGVHFPHLGVLGGGDKTGDVELRTVAAQRQCPRGGSERQPAVHGAARDINTGQFFAPVQRYPGGSVTGREHDAEGRITIVQVDLPDHRPSRADDVDAVRVVASHPGIAGSVHREVARVGADRGLEQHGQAIRVEGGDGVVVRIDRPHPAPLFVALDR